MPMPKKMSWADRLELALRILLGLFNVIRQVQAGNGLEELTLRNRDKTWYENYDAGKYPLKEAEDRGII